MNHVNVISKLKCVAILIFLVVTSFALSYDDAYGLWIRKLPQELLDNSDMIFVGNITSVNVLQFEKKLSYTVEENGTDRQIIENYTLHLNEYKVKIEKFLKNPQNFSIITVREPTVSAAGYESTIGGFQIGDRVLFYVENLDGVNEYSPESFIIPRPCVGKDVLTQQRLEFGRESFTIQNGSKVDHGNFIANKPVLFVYNEDVGTLSGKSFDMLVEIAKTVSKHAEDVFSQEIHAKAKPCEWIAHIEWEFTPQEGDYRMSIARKENNTVTDQSFTGFSVKSDMATHNLLSPLKQFQSGIKVNEIQCIVDLQLAVKSSNGSPACLKSETVKKLVERGWAKLV